jgi:hypothetical protein
MMAALSRPQLAAGIASKLAFSLCQTIKNDIGGNFDD